MQDFDLKAYQRYASALRARFGSGTLFRELVAQPHYPARFSLIRHDVDRKCMNALRMAGLEHRLGLRATYYFRVPYTFDAAVIQDIEAMGHEIGYHYENLSETNGDVPKALHDFGRKLEQLRTVADVRTISMHGRPLKPYDNRDLWRDPERHAMLKERFGILGEVYLDIDYSDIAYINDTGRNWSSGKANRRDKVDSNVKADFASGDELLQYLQGEPHPRLVFQIHRERWSSGPVEHALQWAQDNAINVAKAMIQLVRP